MPRYDFKCPGCGHVRPDVWVSNWRDAVGGVVEIAPCEHCGRRMEKQPSAPNFTVSGFNAKNGYSK